MKSSKPNIIRRSVALPADIIQQARAVAPAELRDNLNGLVVVCLREYVEHRRALAFEAAMEEMARDPALRAESRRINEEFAAADADGLKDG